MKNTSKETAMKYILESLEKKGVTDIKDVKVIAPKSKYTSLTLKGM